MRFSIAGHPVHPHIKLTSEEFPRPLATRILKDDGDEYFGAFLNRTNVRILIDLLNRTFRLRSCAIEIDGSFPVPCTQYYAKRCVAPCVSNLCDRETYREIVDLERLFLRDHRELFLGAVTGKIQKSAEALDFEMAAFYRDILQSVENFWSKTRYKIWLDDTVDTFEVDESDDDSIVVIVISQRGRRTLGELVFAFPKGDENFQSNAVSDLIPQLYRYHVPREIRVPYDFAVRKTLAAELRTKIVVAGVMNPRVTAVRAVEITKARLRLERLRSNITVDDVLTDLKLRLGLQTLPRRIEAFDVAHISATGFAAAVAVWENGKDATDEYEHWMSGQESELTTLREFVLRRLQKTRPDLLLIDGGPSQLKSALSAIEDLARRPDVVAVVKPRGKHSSISHLLTPDGRRIDFDQDALGFRLIQRLRDQAHELANAAHRLSRDMMHFYELAAILPSLNERERQDLLRDFGSIKNIVGQTPETFENRFGATKAGFIRMDLVAFREGRARSPQALIVPIRFVETDGAADDLIPIETRESPRSNGSPRPTARRRRESF